MRADHHRSSQGVSGSIGFSGCPPRPAQEPRRPAELYGHVPGTLKRRLERVPQAVEFIADPYLPGALVLTENHVVVLVGCAHALNALK